MSAWARSAALTAKLESTFTSLFTISAESNPDLLKLLIAVVNALTESAAPKPDILERTRASLVLFRVSSTDKPCLANSFAASAVSANELAVSLAILNKLSPTDCNLDWD